MKLTTLEYMPGSGAWDALLALLLGLVIGGGFVAVLFLGATRSKSAVATVSAGPPGGVAEVLDAMDGAALVVDGSLNVVKASAGAYALGIVAQGRLDSAELSSVVSRVRGFGESIDEEIELHRERLGGTLQVGARASLLGSRFVLLFVEDRTEAFRLEAVRRDFVANISHELKTPIGAVGLLAEALQSAADDPEQVRRFAARLTSESTRIARLMQDVIELSRLQAVDVVADGEHVSIDAVIAQAVDQNRVTAEARDIDLVTGADQAAVVYGDKKVLVTALDNLISNAIRYSPDGSRVGIGSKVSQGIVEVTVADQGEGIAEANLGRIFERFFRVDQARSRQTGGTGLGLSIVKHAVQNHGGDVRVWSQLGKGSTFTIRLPEADQQTGFGEEADSVADPADEDAARHQSQSPAALVALVTHRRHIHSDHSANVFPDDSDKQERAAS